MDKLKDMYYDPKKGLLSEEKLYKKARKEGIDVKLKDVHSFLKDQEVSQVFNQRRVKTFFPLKADAPFQRVQIDLMDMSNMKIRNFKWIFCLVDVYSRYAFCIPLKSKSQSECVRAFTEIIEYIINEFSYSPSRVDSDKESAFISKEFKKVCSDYGTTQFISEINDTRAKAIVERFNRTLRSLIGKYLTAYRTTDWVELLNDITFNYNNTYHRTLQTTPSLAISNNSKYDKSAAKQDSKARKNTYYQDNVKIGDTVRIKIKKGVFDKEGHQWSKTTHKVSQIENGMYYVTDRVNGYKPYEVLPIDKVEEYKPVDKEYIDAQEEVKEDQKQRRTSRRIRKEGIETKDIVNDDNLSRATRRYRKQRDLGPVIQDYN